MSSTPAARSGPGRPGYDREAVVSVAVTLFNERGFDRTSMQDLSERLGIGKSAIYHHVPGKDALLELALDHALEGLETVAAEVRNTPAAAVRRLELLVQGSVRVLIDRLPYVTLLLRVRGNTEVERSALARRRQLDRLAADLVAEGVAEGHLRADVDPAVTARLLFGMVNSLVEWYRPHDDDDPQVLSGALYEMAFRGLHREKDM